jgi:lipopolysaccharide transport system permease protein
MRSNMGTYVDEVWRSRFFWLSLVKMDLQLRYRRSMLGVGWSMLHPLASTCVLCFAFHELFGQSLRSYAPYLMVGLAWWGYVSGVTIQGCQCFVDAESYIRQHSLPMAVYPLRNALGNMIHFVIALTVVLVLVWCFPPLDSVRGFGKLLALAILPFSLTLLLLLGWAVSVLAGYVNSAFRDIQHLATIGFQLLFYLMPIIYPPGSSTQTRLEPLFKYNPLVPFLDIVREPVLKGQIPPLETFLTATLTTLVVTALAIMSLQHLQKRVILYL